MLSQHFQSPSHVQLLLSRPGGSLLEGFCQYLEQRGYAKSSIFFRISAASHFLSWADGEGIPPANLGESALERFSKHLDRCQCQGFVRQRSVVSLRGARLFLMHQGSVGPRATGLAAVEVALKSAQFFAFCRWMRLQRGTSDSTLYNHGNALREVFRFIGDDPAKLDARYLRQFI